MTEIRDKKFPKNKEKKNKLGNYLVNENQKIGENIKTTETLKNLNPSTKNRFTNSKTRINALYAFKNAIGRRSRKTLQ